MERWRRATFCVIVVYLWTMMILLGALVLESFMLYPNIFYDAPRSLEVAMEFMALRGPSDFFPPLGFLSWVTGGGALLLGWRFVPARWWILLSLLMIVADGVVSMLFFWPRNEIMFVEGAAVHSTEFLQQTAREFESLHWLRLALNAASAAFAFVGFVVFDRQQVLAQASHRTAEERPWRVPQDDPAAALG